MTFYNSLILITELMMLAMLIHVAGYSGFTKSQKNWYLLTFFSILVCAGAEYAVHCGYYSAEFKIPLTVITVIQFSLAPLLAVMFIGALGIGHQFRVAVWVLAINLAVEAACAPFGLIFFFSEEGYSRGEYFIIYEAFYVLSLLYLIIGMLLVGKRFRHRDPFTIVMVLVILVSGIIPMTFFKVNVTYTAVAVAASICYIYYNDLVQQDIKAQVIADQQKMNNMQEHMISGLANLIENRDMETGEHILRTSTYVKTLSELARESGVYVDQLSDGFISQLYALAPLHDIGKILIPDSILRKPGKLTPEEYERMKLHATVGERVVKEVLSGVTNQDYLAMASDIATYHHERWDGTGYPKGLKGAEIPLAARIMAIADVYDALISERCYKQPMSREEALIIISEGSGKHFDPRLARVFVENFDKF